MCKRILLLVCMCLAEWANASDFTIVIDAGHGGKDVGAMGYSKRNFEKNLNLDVSLRLADKIRTEYPEINVVLTRSTDVFLTLQERANIVNRNNADLFVCVHTNASDNRNACGAETFILGTDRMDDNLDVAMRENAVMKLEADYQTSYQGFDPNSVDSYIMFELMQNRYLDQSLQFATYVQTRFANSLKRDDRGVRQAAFWVLLKSACPSVLVEMGFISNQEEEKYLVSEKGKNEITDAIFSAFRHYYGPSKQPVDKSTLQTSDSLTVADVPAIQTMNPSTADTKLNSNVSAQVSDFVSGKAETPKEVWGVQIFSSRKELPEKDATFKGLRNCTYKKVGDWYKYIYGNCSSREEAALLKQTLVSKFPDCFVVKIK